MSKISLVKLGENERNGKKRAILRSSLSKKDLLVLKNSYISAKKNLWNLDTTEKDVAALADYILFMSCTSWKGLLIPSLIPLCFAIDHFYKSKDFFSTVSVFCLLYFIILFCTLKVKGEIYKIRMMTVFKLILIRLRLLYIK
ncbi:hypothetical protein [Lonsdalea populi]|uniref:hypothetical protein n=1 Tax=Lonsdalea populi TaxID=1172565 RepID=UPI000DCA35D9|nr:hypothetical protein [Lonsdalea populi]RAT23567.1 hypothetical protein AU487_01190 [Lonsdalea populi]